MAAYLRRRWRSQPTAFWKLLRDRFGEDGGRGRFEEVVRRIVASTADPGCWVEVPGIPDGGIDALIRNPDGALCVWQAKYVFDAKDVVKQARESLKSLGAQGLTTLSEWVLATPIDLSLPARRQVERLVRETLGTSVRAKFRGASDLIDPLLNLGTTYCRDVFGSGAFPRYTQWLAGSALLTTAMWLGWLWIFVARPLSLGSFEGTSPALRSLPAFVPDAGLANFARELREIGFVPIAEGSPTQLRAIMGASWTNAVEPMIPALQAYGNSPVGAACFEFGRAVTFVRDTGRLHRFALSLLVDRQQVSESVRRYGAVCQAIATGDLRSLALMAAVRGYDRSRCSFRLGDKAMRCTGDSAATALSSDDWEPVFEWLGVPESTEVETRLGEIVVGACDIALRRLVARPLEDGVELDVDLHIYGNVPRYAACSFVTWSDDTPFGDTIRTQFGITADVTGEIFAFRVDDGAVSRRRIGEIRDNVELSVVANFPTASGVIEIAGDAGALEPWPARATDECDSGGAMMTTALFPPTFGFEDNPRRFGLDECVSRRVVNVAGDFTTCATEQPVVGANGLELWAGSENAVGQIAPLDTAPKEGHFVSVGAESFRSTGMMVFPRVDTTRTGSGVLSGYFHSGVPCTVEVNGQAAVSQSTSKWPRFAGAVENDRPAKVEFSCPTETDITVRYLQWEFHRSVPSPPIEPSLVRSCRSTYVTKISPRAEQVSWPTLFPSLR